MYYVAQKAARAIGTNNVDNAARVCHAPSTTALKDSIGVAATTCSYRDVIDSDLIVLFGSDVANGQPVFMKYLYLAKKRGAKIAVVNPLREPGLERYWVPSNVESAMFGTKITDEFFPVHTGGDVAFVNGVLKHLLAIGRARPRVRHRAHGRLRRAPRGARGRVVRRARARVGRDAPPTWRGSRACTPRRGACVLVWSMGITQHEHGVDNVHAIVNLGLARGNVGRPGAGLMPIRGHSGVQGGAEMGCYATAFPGGVAVTEAAGRALAAEWGFDVPDRSRVSPRPRWSKRRGSARSTCCGRAAATSSTCCPRPTSRAPRSRARRCACTRTSS